MITRYVLSLQEGMLILTESGKHATERDEPMIALVVLVLKPTGAIFVAWVFAQSVPGDPPNPFQELLVHAPNPPICHFDNLKNR